MSEANGHPIIEDSLKQQKLGFMQRIYESVLSDFFSGADRHSGLDHNSPPPVVSSTRQDGQDRTLRLHTEYDFNAHVANSRDIIASNAYAKAIPRNLTNAVISHGGTLDCDDQGIKVFCEDFLSRVGWNCSKVDLFDDRPVRSTLEVEVLRRVFRDGGCLIYHTPNEEASTDVSLIDIERLVSPGGPNWHFGMLIGDDVTRPLAYNIRWDFDQDQEIPAEWITYCVHPDCDSTVLRALPELVFGIRDALIGAQKQTRAISLGVQMQACLVMVWRWLIAEDGQQAGNILDQAAANKVWDEVTGRKKYMTPPGTTLNVPEGVEPVPLPTAQAAQYRQGVRTDLEMIAGSQAMPYLMFGDSQTANYASAREAGTPFVRQAEMWQGYLSRVTLRVLTRALREAVAAGVISEARVRKCHLTYTYPEVATSTPLEDAQTAAVLQEAELEFQDEGRDRIGRDPIEESTR